MKRSSVKNQPDSWFYHMAICAGASQISLIADANLGFASSCKRSGMEIIMEIFRKMSFADSTGDAIPFYHEGKYHIFL